MPAIPAILRAYLGLVDTAVTQVRELAEHPRELPVHVASKAIALSMKAQHTFTDLTIRGDEVISRWRGEPEETPAWATFDDEPADPDAVGSALPGGDRTPAEQDVAAKNAPTKTAPTKASPAQEALTAEAASLSPAAAGLAGQLIADQHASIDRIDGA